MQASVIVPNYRNDDTLPATLASLATAAAALPPDAVEIVVLSDPDGKGLAWARNRGLDRARGEYVFFCDADDTVRPDFFRLPIAELERTQADFCFFDYSDQPLKRDYDLVGNDEIRKVLLPAFIGYGWRDVVRAIFGGGLAKYREPGSVCRVAFRRAFLETHRIRFNEQLFIYEDAPFLCECALHAQRVASLRKCLYDYTPGANGIIRTATGGSRHWAYKSAILAERERLNAIGGGGLRRYYRASQFLGKLEFLLHFFRRFGIIHAHKPQTGL